MSELVFLKISDELGSQIFASLSNISHPIQGTFYLFLLAVFVRRIWPKTWNNFLKKIAAKVDLHIEKD